ncbi:hypothetical protein EDB85DRAFT_1518676 [Lactarius pseudohatsudake]|nr:hypothetical protein EDB85DRAFT_1518676 [Lactarius pseudohatsudake]
MMKTIAGRLHTMWWIVGSCQNMMSARARCIRASIDKLSLLQSITAHNGHAGDHDLPVWPSNSMLSPKAHSDLGSEPPPCHPTPQRTHPSHIHSPQHEGLAKLFSTNPSLDSLQSFHTAITSLSCSSIRQTSPTPTVSSDMSFPYSVTSINSYNTRKNVLYPRRAHPPPQVPSITSQYRRRVKKALPKRILLTARATFLRLNF